MPTTITKETARALPLGAVLHHTVLKNADGTPLRARKTGSVKTWATRPNDFRLPMKHGLKQCFYIDQNNAYLWVLPE